MVLGCCSIAEIRASRSKRRFYGVFAKFLLERFVPDCSPQTAVAAGLDERFPASGDGGEVRIAKFRVQLLRKRRIRLFRI